MLRLPNFIVHANIRELLFSIANILDSAEDEIDIDAGNIKFIDPIGICVLASLCESLANQSRTIKLHNLSHNLESYLSRMDLLQQCGYEYDETKTRLDRSDSLVEVTRVESQQNVETSASQISNCLVGTTPDYDESAPFDEMTGYQPHTQLEDNLQYVFNELLENSLTHGRKFGYSGSNVWVASQFYRQKDIIKLGIVDNGCGFLRTLRDHEEKPESDYDAIELALKPYTSCNRDVGIMADSYNEGVGLTVISHIVGAANGDLSVFSGRALNNYKAGACNGYSSLSSPWRGVGISISMPRDNFKRVLYRDIINRIREEGGSPNTENVDIQFI